MWDKIINILPDFVKGIFSTVDQLVVDKDAANQIKLEILTTVAGKGATSWLAQNAFSLAMLANFGMVVVLSLIGRTVPEWSIFVALIWLSGPLLNTLSKETLGKIIELVKDFKNEQRKQTKAGDISPATKTGG
jgi:hypothetical protein